MPGAAAFDSDTPELWIVVGRVGPGVANSRVSVIMRQPAIGTRRMKKPEAAMNGRFISSYLVGFVERWRSR